MAKITNCVFCNKEITKGFFTGDDVLLDVGVPTLLTCCEECYNKYKSDVKSRKKRFAQKFENVKKASKKKITEKEIANMYLLYLDEEQKQLSKCGNQILDMFLGFFTYNANGYFSVLEYGKGFSSQDITASDMAKSVNRAKNTGCAVFDKDDITKIEYAKIGSGSFVGFTHKAYSYAIRLNDEKVMTYKPCITRSAVLGSGFAFGYEKSAEKKLISELNEFKRIIGSNLPIVKVKSI